MNLGSDRGSFLPSKRLSLLKGIINGGHWKKVRLFYDHHRRSCQMHFGESTKGQTNSKWFFQADVSSKKWTKKVDFTTFVDLFSSVFWKKVKTQKGHFEINWPLARTHNLIHTFHTQILHSIFQNYPRCTFACQSLDYIPIYSNSNKEQTQLLDCPPLQGMKSICSLSKSVSFNWYTERESFLPHTPLVKFMVAREELSLLPLNIPQNSPPNRPL